MWILLQVYHDVGCNQHSYVQYDYQTEWQHAQYNVSDRYRQDSCERNALFVQFYQDWRSQVVIRQREESSGSGSNVCIVDRALSQDSDDYENHTPDWSPEFCQNVGVTISVWTPFFEVTDGT